MKTSHRSDMKQFDMLQKEQNENGSNDLNI